MLLNEHLIQFAKIPPIRYHVSHKHDELLNQAHENDTKLIWIKRSMAKDATPMKAITRKQWKELNEGDMNKAIQIGIENCPNMRAILLAFLNDHRKDETTEFKIREECEAPAARSHKKKSKRKWDFNDDRP